MEPPVELWLERLAGQLGMVLYILAEANRDSKKQPRPFVLRDFAPWLEAVTKKQTPRQMEIMLKQSVMMHNAAVKAHERKRGKP